jgi:hypothetical protein
MDHSIVTSTGASSDGTSKGTPSAGTSNGDPSASTARVSDESNFATDSTSRTSISEVASRAHKARIEGADGAADDLSQQKRLEFLVAVHKTCWKTLEEKWVELMSFDVCHKLKKSAPSLGQEDFITFRTKFSALRTKAQAFCESQSRFSTLQVDSLEYVETDYWKTVDMIEKLQKPHTTDADTTAAAAQPSAETDKAGLEFNETVRQASEMFHRKATYYDVLLELKKPYVNMVKEWDRYTRG